jgi:hypothetical protein
MLVDIMSRAPKTVDDQLVLWRGMNIDMFDGESSQRELGFMSTTSVLRHAVMFANAVLLVKTGKIQTQAAETVLKIQVPNNTPVLALTTASAHPSECEWLLGPNLLLTCIKKCQVSDGVNGYQVKIDQLPKKIHKLLNDFPACQKVCAIETS